MNPNDPIASPTLALLYLGQGHRRRAKAVIEQVLAEDPVDGCAQVIANRLVRTEPVSLRCSIGDDIEFSWQGVTHSPQLYLVWYLAVATDGFPNVSVSSIPCTSSFGTHALRKPPGLGSIVAAIGRPERARGWITQGSLGPISWPPVATE
jgi:hypothetical protein